VEAVTNASDDSRLSEEAGEVRNSTLALASYWLGAIRQYSRHNSSNPPTTDAISLRRRTTTSQSSRKDVEELCRLTLAMGGVFGSRGNLY
jgi:hypothetical protein